nr:RNA-directed DNA polymerase, eukaryota, reverse transcriptase zinc-binding domain protein [Tanacetum cinerariifolium]
MGASGSFNSKEDLTMKISNSVFVTNFPEHFSSQDLWKNLDRLIGNLYTIWIGRLHLHVNPVKFHRDPKVSLAQQPWNKEGLANNSFALVLKTGSQSHKLAYDSSPAIVLDDSCVEDKDLSGALNALSTLYSLLENEGFDKVNLTYLGGFWVLIEMGSSKSKENMYEDDATLPYKKLCIITKPRIRIDNRIKVIVKGCVYWVRVKELDVWAPDFNNYLSDNDSNKELPDDEILNQGSGYNDLDCVSNKDNDIDHVSESSCMNNFGAVPENSGKSKDAKTLLVDPFGIYDNINKKPNNSENKTDDPTFPLGFTPGDMADNHVGTKDDSIDKPMGDVQPNKEGRSSSKSRNNSILNIKPGGSILDVLENLVEIGQTMGYNMDGCMKNIESIIGDQGDIGPSVGCSGGILCVWDPNMFIKDNVSILNSFVAIRGEFHLIEQWDVECVILGDFNESKKDNHNPNVEKHATTNRLAELDRLIDQGNGTEDLVKERTGHLKHLQDINNRSSLDMAQKAKIRWSIEGDENSKYFHVKNEFLNHFTNRFSKPISPKILLDSQMLHTLASEQVDDLERNVTYGEIKRAVWDYGTNKSPGPDGFSFDFISGYWKIIEKDVVKAVEEFFDSIYFPPDCNASFITLIPNMKLNWQIPDGPFILNELISWSKAKKSKVMIFKIDFEKDFDSVRWDFLDDTLVKFGLVLNGEAGYKIINAGLFKGIRIDNSLTLTHLFYADDAVFIAMYGDCGPLIILISFLGPPFGPTLSKKLLVYLLKDMWLDDRPLKLCFPHLFALECDKNVSVSNKICDPSLFSSFRREPRGGIEEEQHLNLVKRFNLSLHGLDIPSILSPVCHSAGESSSHIFFSCNVAHLLIQKVARWWELDVADLFSYDDWLTWLSALRLAKGTKSILEGVFYVMWWVI